MQAKLCAVTVGARKTPKLMWGRALWKDGVLIMEAPTAIENDYPTLLRTLEQKIKPLSSKGYSMAMDGSDRKLAINAFCKHVDFFGKNEDGESILGAVYNRYLQMRSLNQIMFPQNDPGAYQIGHHLVNGIVGLDGRKKYEFDWDRVQAEHLYTLTLVWLSGLSDIEHTGYYAELDAAHEEQGKAGTGFFAKVAEKVKTVLGITGEDNIPVATNATQLIDAPPVVARSEMARGMNAITHCDRVAAEKAPKSLAGQSGDGWIIF